jgi:hypothetical protein
MKHDCGPIITQSLQKDTLIRPKVSTYVTNECNMILKCYIKHFAVVVPCILSGTHSACNNESCELI